MTDGERAAGYAAFRAAGFGDPGADGVLERTLPDGRVVVIGGGRGWGADVYPPGGPEAYAAAPAGAARRDCYNVDGPDAAGLLAALRAAGLPV